jgi:hypothetical protein
MAYGKGKSKDGYESCNLKKSFQSAGANVRGSRLNKGGDTAFKGKRTSTGARGKSKAM